MKKCYMIIVVVCALIMTACGTNSTSENTEKNGANAQNKISEEQFKGRENIDLKFFKIYYPKSWNYDKENMQKENEFARATFYDGEERDNSLHEITISATSESAYSFREDLDAYGINLKDYKEGKLEELLIGNTEYTVIPVNNSKNIIYRYRHETSGVSYMVNISKGDNDDSVKELLEGVWLETKDEGKKDSPWPWEGEAFKPTLKEEMVGSYTIVPEYIPFEEPQGIFKTMENKFYKKGNKLYHLLENKLDTYEYSSDKIKFISTMELEDDYEYISADPEGMLYLSQGISEIIGVKDGKKSLQTTVTGDLAMHPSGEWGISFWVNSDTQKITKQDGNLKAEPWILTDLNDDSARKGEFSMIDNVEVSEQHIIVAGNVVAEDDNKKIIVYDLDGNKQLEMGGKEISDPDKLGSITGMAETENGFVAIDGNMRTIQFWNKEGVHVGAIDTEDIFGMGYSWLEDMQLLDDGSILIMATQKRNDESANELMMFRLTGF